MKRLLILLVGCLLIVAGMQAQNANRSGFFIELQGGGAIGTVMDYRTEVYGNGNDYEDCNPYIKGGFVGGIDLGYRFATSRAFAFEVKVDAWSNFLDFGKCLYLDLLPGIRWTSEEIASNVSMFLSLNAGFGILKEDVQMNIPIEIGLGCNLTNQFYLGLFLSERIYMGDSISGYYDSGYYGDYYDDYYWESGSYLPKSYASVGLKLGYRF